MADPITAQLAKISQAASKQGFEIQFNNLQNSLIKRFNSEVEKIEDSSTIDHKVKALQKESARLASALPVLEQYRVNNQNNYSQLDRISDDLADLRALINDDNTVTADEVTAFTELRDKIAARANNLFIFVHPDINDGNIIPRFKDSVPDFEAITPVAGSLDGDNAGLLDALDEFITQASVAATVTSNTVSTTLDLESKVQQEFSNADTELLSLTFEEKERRQQEIDDLKVDLGNTLRAISLSFEINSELATQLNSALTAPVPAPGSVLNMFT
ncbi:MAG: hypothetical protein JJ855_03560 [Rhodospirillales bacterium]|nr:hypothetical protein [Rhodospirillales bacterium]